MDVGKDFCKFCPSVFGGVFGGRELAYLRRDGSGQLIKDGAPGEPYR